ncbi:MAG: LacI family DNA-binding transcriptional regulator [Lachnospiraceae bacterium]
MGEATIKDIAKASGVSISTVSRVINGNYPVSREARERVEEAMQRLDYRPNAIARSLRNQKTNLVALVVADLSNPFFMEIAKGLEEEMASIGCQLVIASSGGSVQKERELLNTLIEKRIDGLVIASSDNEGEHIKTCIEAGMPVVLVDRSIEGVRTSQILWDDEKYSYQLTKLFIDNGHKDIGIVNVTLTNPNGMWRFEGFRRALKEARIPEQPEFISSSNFSSDEACSFVTRMMSGKNRPTAIFCANNIMLQGTLQALRNLGIRLYDDVSVAVFGNPECNRYISPMVTAARQDTLKMGQMAGELLKNLISKTENREKTLILKSEILMGGSIKKIG